MIIWFLVYTTIAISNGSSVLADTHYRKYATRTECMAAKDAFNGVENMFAECFATKIDQPASAPKTSL